MPTNHQLSDENTHVVRSIDPELVHPGFAWVPGGGSEGHPGSIIDESTGASFILFNSCGSHSAARDIA